MAGLARAQLLVVAEAQQDGGQFRTVQQHRIALHKVNTGVRKRQDGRVSLECRAGQQPVSVLDVGGQLLVRDDACDQPQVLEPVDEITGRGGPSA
jgi:hypothetical protein